MFSRRNSPPSKPQSTTPTGNNSRAATPFSVLAPNLSVVGNLESDGDIQIDGKVDGDIHTNKLTVGEKAVVNGSIMGNQIRIAGTVNGEITGREVILLSTAKVTGDINHDSLSIDAGAYVQGLCKRVDVELLSPGDKKRKPQEVSDPTAGAAEKPENREASKNTAS